MGITALLESTTATALMSCSGRLHLYRMINNEGRMTYNVNQLQSQCHPLLVAFTGEDEAVLLEVGGSSN